MARNNDTNDGMYHPDGIDRLLMAGAGFDWITPLFSLFSGARGRTERFSVPESWFYLVDDVLGNAGIETRNQMLVDGDYVFDIRKDDADEAAALLGLVRR